MSDERQQPQHAPHAPQPQPQPQEEEIRFTSTDDGEESAITEPGKLVRLGHMMRALQEELRSDNIDAPSRERLGEIHHRVREQLGGVMSGPLREELDSFELPFGEDPPTESELRLAQAQLIGWLEGLFQGIQLAIAGQQQAAQRQLQQPPAPGQERPTGHYM